MTSTLLHRTLPLNQPRIHQLPNGLTIVAEQMPGAVVSFNLWLNVGSALESDEINGMAHFLEHMIFKGTPNLPSGEFERRIEERGAVTNAATSQDYTHYYLTAAAQDFGDLLPLQLEVVLNACMPDGAFERERSVVLEEIRRSEDNPSRRVYMQAMETCFERSPYRRPVLGPTEVIQGLRPQQMRDFHAQWYQPHQMTAAVVGNLPVEMLIQQVEESFGAVYEPRSPLDEVPDSPPWEDFLAEPPFEGIVRRELTDSRVQQARLVMVWRVPGLLELGKTYGLDVLATLLGQGKLSRLFRDLREERQLVTSIGVSNMTYHLQGVFYVAAQLPTENVAVVEEAIAQHLRSFQEEPVNPKDLARIQTQVANRFVFNNERPSDRTSLYGYYYCKLRDLEPALTYPQRIQAITPADIQNVAQCYLNPDAYGMVVVRPATSN
ncbi:insulinase family protein [Spirulina subsalsa FACHB-351]|uniref:Insulinase family protein n=1 Tax=Spirulina subsalsa FACHB-351 TaxID=234711 RepID=A0ABT3L6E7_9CYAN|nr:pitrilysin family protein [Spirulina subsalsa]MCW6036747.1 insulinase family protein [Spirulina subsalsa FACHB-351]